MTTFALNNRTPASKNVTETTPNTQYIERMCESCQETTPATITVSGVEYTQHVETSEGIFVCVDCVNEICVITCVQCHGLFFNQDDLIVMCFSNGNLIARCVDCCWQ